jgi:AmiR/NasT family two-component response regulator
VTMELPENLRQSRSRGNVQVHQATGMIVAQTGATAEEALSRLVSHAEDIGAPVHHVAADVIERRLSFS